MKQTILFMLMLSAISLQAQLGKSVEFSYSIIYDYNFQPNKDDKATRASELMYLQAGKDFSSYMSLNQYRTDSVIEELSREAEATNRIPSMNNGRVPPASIPYKIFKDKQQNLMYFLSRFMVHRAHYKEAIPAFNWQLHDEENEVAGYTCRKATTSYAGRDYIAWYAPAIDLRDGPFKFNGLPGLILLIHDTDKEHVLTATAIEKKNILAALREWKGMYIHEFATKEEYLAYVKKMKEDPSLMVQQDLIRLPEDKLDEMVAKLKTSIEKNNNPIER